MLTPLPPLSSSPSGIAANAQAFNIDPYSIIADVECRNAQLERDNANLTSGNADLQRASWGSSWMSEGNEAPILCAAPTGSSFRCLTDSTLVQ